jgi:hypothetical protein
MPETWIQIDSRTSQLVLGDGSRITITAAAGAPAPEAWWAAEHLRDRLEVWERLAGSRLEAMSIGERVALARAELDDGGPTGGSLLRRFVRHCQQAPPDEWPADVRLAVLRAIASRIRPAIADVQPVG